MVLTEIEGGDNDGKGTYDSFCPRVHSLKPLEDGDLGGRREAIDGFIKPFFFLTFSRVGRREPQLAKKSTSFVKFLRKYSSRF